MGLRPVSGFRSPFPQWRTYSFTPTRSQNWKPEASPFAGISGNRETRTGTTAVDDPKDPQLKQFRKPPTLKGHPVGFIPSKDTAKDTARGPIRSQGPPSVAVQWHDDTKLPSEQQGQAQEQRPDRPSKTPNTSPFADLFKEANIETKRTGTATKNGVSKDLTSAPWLDAVKTWLDEPNVEAPPERQPQRHPIRRLSDEDDDLDADTEVEIGDVFFPSPLQSPQQQERHRHQQQQQQQPRHDESLPTTLTLTGASPSLLPSDFYRLAPRSSQVHGWTTGGSLSAVLQARHPVTHDALGHYTLLFDSHAAALAYLDTAVRLHRESARPRKGWETDLAVSTDPRPPGSGSGSPSMPWGGAGSGGSLGLRRPRPGAGAAGGGGGAGSTSPASARAGAAAASPSSSSPSSSLSAFSASPPPSSNLFTLAPPSSPLSLTVRRAMDAEASRRELAEAAQRRTAELTRVLVRIGDDAAVETSIVGQLLQRDAAERNLAWRLRSPGAVVPVRIALPARRREAGGAAEGVRRSGLGVDVTGRLLLSSLGGREGSGSASGGGGGVDGEVDSGGDGDPGATGNRGGGETRFSRFVISFEDSHEARRFAREWHGRKVQLPGGKVTHRVTAHTLW